jgi:hypothetical protein
MDFSEPGEKAGLNLDSLFWRCCFYGYVGIIFGWMEKGLFSWGYFFFCECRKEKIDKLVG